MSYQKLPAVLRRLAGGRMLVQRLDADTPVSLSGSAPLIWDLLDTTCTVDGLTSALLERYSDDPNKIEAGVRAGLALLDEYGLVQQDSVTEQDSIAGEETS